MKKILPIFMMMFMMPFVANAQIASKAYVDEQDNTIIYGNANPDADDVSAIEDAGGVKGYIDSFASDLFDPNNGIIPRIGEGITDLQGDVSDIQTALGDAVSVNQSSDGFLVSDNGSVGIITGNFIDDNMIINEGISLGKLVLPDIPAACSATGGSCSLMYVGGTGFVWEVVARNTGESAPTAGAVTGTVNEIPVAADFPADTVGVGVPSISLLGCSTNADCDQANGYRCDQGTCKIIML